MPPCGQRRKHRPRLRGRDRRRDLPRASSPWLVCSKSQPVRGSCWRLPFPKWWRTRHVTAGRPELGVLRELQEFDRNRRRRRGGRVYGRGREAPPGQGQVQPDQRQGEDAAALTRAPCSPRGAVGFRAVGRLSGPLGRLPVLTSLGFYLLLIFSASHTKTFITS